MGFTTSTKDLQFGREELSAPVLFPFPLGVQLLGRRALVGGLWPEEFDRRALTGGRWSGGFGRRASDF